MSRFASKTALAMCAAALGTPAIAMSDDAKQRYLSWAEKRVALEDRTAFDVMSDMLEALDGCILPAESCKNLISLAETARNHDPFLASWNVLGAGMTSLHAATECETKRSGSPVVGPTLSTGNTDFVVMTVSSNADENCFVRSLGTE